MRIAFSGTANTGKSTLVKDFLTVWPMYKTTAKTYRDVIAEKNLPHSKSVNKVGQEAILDFMIEEMSGKTPEDFAVYDRCTLDNIVYSFWANEKGGSDIDDEFISKCIPKVRESLKNLDIIFWLPFSDKIPITNDNMRETDVEYIKEINNIFEVIYNQYIYNDKFILFDKEDRPAIIPIYTSDRLMRIREVANYVAENGTTIAPDDSWVNELQNEASESNPQDAMKELLEQQKLQLLKSGGGFAL